MITLALTSLSSGGYKTVKGVTESPMSLIGWPCHDVRERFLAEVLLVVILREVSLSQKVLEHEVYVLWVNIPHLFY